MESKQSEWVRNVSGFVAANPVVVHSPTSLKEIVSLVESRLSAATRLRVVSSGRNWGLGSASSPDDCELLELSGMDAIRSINDELGYAVIEPGVSQAELSMALKGTQWYLNCTASSADTSVLGNIMDRGVGIRHQRTDDLLGLEVVLGDGRAGTIGWWPEGRGGAPNRYGLGPSMLHAFTQANFGIATAAVVQLQPRPEVHEVLTSTIDEVWYADLLTELRSIARQQLSSGVIKVYDPVSTDLYGGQDAVVTTHIGIEGTEGVVRAKREAITQRLQQIGATINTAASVVSDPLSGAVTNLYHGDVSRSEDIVHSALGVSTVDADREGKGWIFSLPFIPFTVADVSNARRIVSSVARRTGLSIGTTVNVLTHDVVDLVIAIRFDRQSQGSAAQAALDSLTSELIAAGYFPYRLDTARNRSDVITSDDIEADLIQRLHAAFDPHGSFASSRYTQ